MKTRRLRAFASQGFRYALVGIVAASVHFAVALLTFKILQWPPWAANAAGYCSGFVVSYVGQSRFTFGYRGAHAPAVVKWFAAWLATLGATSLLVQALVRIDAQPLAAFAVGVAAGPAVLFVAGRYWAFR